MSDESQRQYFNPLPPTESTTPGVGVTLLATAVTAAAFDLSLGGTSTAFFGKRLKFVVQDGTNGIWISFSSDGVTAIDKTVAGGASLTAGTGKANAIKLLPNSITEFRLDRSAQKFLHVQADAGTPVLAIYPSSEPRLSDK